MTNQITGLPGPASTALRYPPILVRHDCLGWLASNLGVASCFPFTPPLTSSKCAAAAESPAVPAES